MQGICFSQSQARYSVAYEPQGGKGNNKEREEERKKGTLFRFSSNIPEFQSLEITGINCQLNTLIIPLNAMQCQYRLKLQCSLS